MSKQVQYPLLKLYNLSDRFEHVRTNNVNVGFEARMFRVKRQKLRQFCWINTRVTKYKSSMSKQNSKDLVMVALAQKVQRAAEKWEEPDCRR